MSELGAALPLPVADDAALARLARRRSAPAQALGAPGPDARQLARLLEVAARTPDHGKLFPWRFVIIEGHAEAWVDGQKVGDVQKDEIFGAMAVFTREKRSATVIASEPCTVMVIPKDQFLSLMQSNPRIAHSLIESMARRIDLMNKEVTQLRAQLQPA